MLSEEEFNEFQVGLAALAYYLYRQAGCPMGDTHAGLEAWVKIQMSVLEELANRED